MVNIKTRDEIYGKEASDILRVITTYKCLLENQIYRLYQKNDKVIKNLLSHLTKQGRINYNSELKYYTASKEDEINLDYGLISAFWVLLDFIDQVEYHSICDFPSKICFFADGEVYEIIHVPYEQEVLMNHAYSQNEDVPRRIVLVDRPEQIDHINIVHTIGYCIVSLDGSVQYFKLEE